MKKKILTVLAPAILGATTIVPMCTMTSCGDKTDVSCSKLVIVTTHIAILYQNQL